MPVIAGAVAGGFVAFAAAWRSSTGWERRALVVSDDIASRVGTTVIIVGGTLTPLFSALALAPASVGTEYAADGELHRSM